MFFDKFFADMYIRKIAKKCIPILALILNIIEKTDQVGVYAEVKRTLQDASIRIRGRSPQQAEKIWKGISLNEMLNRIAMPAKKDPVSAFFMLTEIIARFLTKEKFEQLFKELLPEVPPDILNALLFENKNINLQFKNSIK